MIGKKELKFVIFWSLIILILTFIPLAYGYLAAPEGMHFMGFTDSVMDQNTYFDYINQAADGKLTFINSFTSEDTKPLLVRPLYLVMGLFSKITHIPALVTYHLFRILLVSISLISAYYFISYFIRDILTRKVAFLFVAITSGFGFFFYILSLFTGHLYRSADIYIDIIPFLSFDSAPHIIFSLILILLIYLFFLIGYTENRAWYVIYSALFTFLLGFEHIYDAVTIYFVLGIFSLLSFLMSKNFSIIKRYALFVVISVPSSVYYLSIFTLNPVFKEWAGQNITPQLKLSIYIAGFGLVFFLALLYLGIWLAKKEYRKPDKLLFLITWAVVNFILIQIPLNVRIRFALGLYIPLSILAAICLVNCILPSAIAYFRRFNLFNLDKGGVKLTLIILILLVMSATNIYLLVQKTLAINEPPASIWQNRKYLYNEELEALGWLRENTAPDEIVLSNLNIGNYIPRISKNRVFLGHWAQTANLEEKQEKLKQFFSSDDSFRKDLISEYRISYIYYGSEEQSLGSFNPENSAYLEKVFENQRVKIYKARAVR